MFPLLNSPSLPQQVTLGADTTAVLLEGLNPETTYSIQVLALHGEAVSEPLEDQGTTCRSPPALWPLWPERALCPLLGWTNIKSCDTTEVTCLSSSSSAAAPCWRAENQ